MKRGDTEKGLPAVGLPIGRLAVGMTAILAALTG